MIRVLLAVLGLATAGAITLPAAGLDERLAELDRAHPALLGARTGYLFTRLRDGKVLASRNAGDFFTPASNAKLFTTACALVRLGPAHRFETRVWTSGPDPNDRSVLRDLVLEGGGDPDFSGQPMPYRAPLWGSPSMPDDPMRAMRMIADRLVHQGITAIAGDVVGLSSRYGGSRYPEGWTFDDGLWGYGAPPTALMVHDNAAVLTVLPTAPGEPAALDMNTGSNYYLISNQVLTSAEGKTDIKLDRLPGSTELLLSGSIKAGGPAWQTELGIDDPALWAAGMLIAALHERGIAVSGQAREDYTGAASGTCLFSFPSAPLAEIIKVINKVSQNQHAEMLLHELAIAGSKPGTAEAGAEVRSACLRELGVGGRLALNDGSGLARQDLVTPEASVSLLRAMWGRPERQAWYESLPIGSVDGSLQNRFRGIAGAQRVHAKTGSLSHVAALAGYIDSEEGDDPIVFSIMVNGAVAGSREVRDYIDRLVAVFLHL